MPFLGQEVAVRQVSDEDWELLEDLVYQGRSDRLVVEKGSITDFASVPHFLTWLVPRYGRYTRAAVLHDHLCREAHQGRFSRYDADGIFRRSMRELGVGFLRRWLMWLAVRFGAGWKGFWEGGFWRGLAVGFVGLVCLVLLSPPIVTVLVWLLLVWILEWVLLPGLKLGSRRKSVNRPRGILGT